MTNVSRIAVTVDGRTVYWDVTAGVAVVLLQAMVQTYGPAKEG